MENTIRIIAQAIGIVAMVVNILSFQCKKNKNLFIVIGIGSVLFSISFLMLGAYVSAIYNVISIIRSTLALNKKFFTKTNFYVLCALYVIGTIFAYDNPWSIVLFAAQIVQTYVMWFKDGSIIRKAQYYFVSPVWIVNNIIVFSIGGILCELFMMTSAFISYLRYKKSGFEK